jgi:hypothetical protein
MKMTKKAQKQAVRERVLSMTKDFTVSHLSMPWDLRGTGLLNSKDKRALLDDMLGEGLIVLVSAGKSILPGADTEFGVERKFRVRAMVAQHLIN